MRAVATLLASIAMALGALGLAVAAPGGGDNPRVALASASGAVQISNSRAGHAVFTAAAMRPGEGVSGTVRIGNSGDAPGSFAVRLAGLSDVPGPYGGRLSNRVELVLFDVTDVQQPVTVYAGAPAGFADVALGTFAAGAHRDYLVAATLPDGGLPGSDAGGDNRYQGSALSLGFEWRAGPAGGEPSPTPTPTPPPTNPPTPPPTSPPATNPPTTPTISPPGTTPPATPTISPPGTTPPTTPPTSPPATTSPGGPSSGPTGPSSGPTGDALADALGLPPARGCVSRRRFKIRLRAPGGAKVRSATVKVKGKQTVRVKGRRAVVSLRGLRKGRVKVRITVRASNARTYRSKRTYRTCAGR
ncbi:MAG: hypothetical protein ACRDPC_09855 [Solirubrobacteraceae bacterium]